MRDAYLEAMGIERWVRREPHPVDAPVPGDAVTEEQSLQEQSGNEAATTSAEATLQQVNVRESHALDALGWDELAERVSTCTLCDLHSTRTQTVFGVGSRDADWMIIGEAPGADEDREGEPFVGRAGQLLTAMIEAMGMRREQVYIANILKCRPPQNRDPKPDEVMDCMAYLHRQIELVQPKVILAVGRVAAQNLLNVDSPMKALRGKSYEYADTGIPVFVTYHPAYLLRSPAEKGKAWQDLQLAMRCYDEVSA